MAETKTNIPVEIKMGNAGTNDANLPAFKEGSIIFTKDTKKIYIDPVGETERIAVGGTDVDLSGKQDIFADLDYVWQGNSVSQLSLSLKSASNTTSTGGMVSLIPTLAFTNEAGQNVKLTGIANGTTTYDAVNKGQLDKKQDYIKYNTDLTVGSIITDPDGGGRHISKLENTSLNFTDKAASATLPSMLITPAAHSGTTPACLTLASPAQTTAVGHANVRLTGIAAPTADNDAVNKAYVDTQVATKQAKFAEYTSTRPSEGAPASASTNILVLNEGMEFYLRDRATNPLVEFKINSSGALEGTTNYFSLTTKGAFNLKSNIFALSNDKDTPFQVVTNDSKKIVYYGLNGGDDNGSLYLTNTSRTGQQGATLQGNVSSDSRTTALVVNESNTKLLSWKQGTTTNNAPLLGVSTPVATADTSKGITADDLDYQAVNKKYVDDIKTELLNAITHPYTYDETTKELTLIL